MVRLVSMALLGAIMVYPASVAAKNDFPPNVTIATVSSSSPFGPTQVSASPARPIGCPSRRWMKYGRVGFAEPCH